MTAPLRWDVFCRVVDNHGDVGVCWRLAADLAGRGHAVRLWIDNASALSWMAPDGAAGVELRTWPGDDTLRATDRPGDVVIEAFGCALPACFVERMAARPTPPVWINLEYLSAEAYVERVHRLASPQSAGPGVGLRKTFFYPGFTPRTGGLLREPGLLERQRRFDRAAWLHAQGAALAVGERVVSLFCYEQPALSTLLTRLAARPTLLLVTAGQATRQLETVLGDRLQLGALRAHRLPHLPQTAFDEMLWAADLNFVRGEDSFVRAQWAGRPFVWQAYPQPDDAHLPKLDAFIDRHVARAPAALADAIRVWSAAWNAGQVELPAALPPLTGWGRHVAAWRSELLVQADLSTQLIDFAHGCR